MNDKKFVFAGNRFSVLEEMIAKDLDVEVLAVRGSYLQRQLDESGRPYTAIEDRGHLISRLATLELDIFLANGCPFILPISELKTPEKTFVNIHPGPLPDLRGVDPVPGALLFGRDSGATCHIMDDGIDTGPIISRVVVPNSGDLDAGLLYQISFLAEKEAFNLAYQRSFQPQPEAEASSEGLYYTKKDRDLAIDFDESTDRIVRRIKAFSNRSQGARFSYGGRLFRVFDAELSNNPYLMQKRENYEQNQVVFRYEDCLLLRHGKAYVKLKSIDGDLSSIQVGDRLGGSPRPDGEGGGA